MKKLISNKYANFYLNAAEKLGLEYTILNKRVGLVRVFNQTTTLDISSNVLGVNSQLSSSLSVNKIKTSVLLKEDKIPVPGFKSFSDSETAIDYALSKLQSQKPVVIKPISGSLSIGVTVNPSSITQIRRAVTEAFEGNSSIMVEEYIPGLHFRITILDDEIIAITQRIPANVTADGKKTVLELIAEKNIVRRKMRLPDIFLRKKDYSFLSSEKIELSKIFPKDTLLTLQLGCDLDIGGERKRIDVSTIPSINNEMLLRAAKTLGLRFAGIDYITPDILTPYTQITTAVNEINSAPDSDVHYRDSYPHNNYAAERILEKIFQENATLEKPLAIPSPFIQAN